MNLLASRIGSLMTAVVVGLSLHGNATAQPAEAQLLKTVREIETKLDARIGVLVRDTASQWEWGHRQDERFLMASTFKSVLCGAVLDRVERGLMSLDEQLEIRRDELVAYSPVTEKAAGKTMSVSDLCLATLDISDNTAANILIERLGGTQEVTAFARSIGDAVTRLDRIEPDLNLFVPGDPRDTTTPAAILTTWESMLLGDALSSRHRALLLDWMSRGGVTGALLRASTPDNWHVADKSGGGQQHTRNLVAMVTPPDDEPHLIAIYVSDTQADWAARNQAVKEIGEAIVQVISHR
ncbi:class A beta-lactamase [Neoaquamicrobium sediminum]|uniref:class A beta-lactamase n=1 Tax=Neoaquamicrobium sediminum TaxID=1849104 RepID=UPI00361D4AAB